MGLTELVLELTDETKLAAEIDRYLDGHPEDRQYQRAIVSAFREARMSEMRAAALREARKDDR